MRIALALAAASTLIACSTAQTQTQTPDPRCAYDADAMLAMDQQTFDRTTDAGWRLVGNIEGCEAAAADLIARYRATHADIEDPKGLLHHEAQLRAASGQTETALALLRETRALETAPEMLAYRDAEIAFLSGDREALMAARARLLALPPPDGFEASVATFRQRFPNAIAPSWPLNIEVVNGFVACFGRPYREAYTAPCRGSEIAP